MKKKMPLYELLFIIAAILAIGCILVLAFPVKNEKESLQAQRTAIENQTMETEPYIRQMNMWKEELDQLRAEGELTSIPDYDNIDNIINELDVILNDTGKTINYGDVTCENSIVTRKLTISFSTNNYDVLKRKVEAIHNSSYKYQITNISIAINNGTYNCNMEIVAYEYNESGEL